MNYHKLSYFCWILFTIYIYIYISGYIVWYKARNALLSRYIFCLYGDEHKTLFCILKRNPFSMIKVICIFVTYWMILFLIYITRTMKTWPILTPFYRMSSNTIKGDNNRIFCSATFNNNNCPLHVIFFVLFAKI